VGTPLFFRLEVGGWKLAAGEAELLQFTARLRDATARLVSSEGHRLAEQAMK
jgi:hypothetical protein